MKNINKLIWWIFMATIMLIIFRFSSEKAVDSADTSKGFIRVLIDILPFTKDLTEIAKQEFISSMDFIIRKCAHFTLYALLGFVTFGAIKFTFLIGVKSNAIWTFVICLLYAISDEIHQYFVPGRACRMYDICIDSFGSIFGISLFVSLCFLIKKYYIEKVKC